MCRKLLKGSIVDSGVEFAAVAVTLLVEKTRTALWDDPLRSPVSTKSRTGTFNLRCKHGRMLMYAQRSTRANTALTLAFNYTHAAIHADIPEPDGTATFC